MSNRETKKSQAANSNWLLEFTDTNWGVRLLRIVVVLCLLIGCGVGSAFLFQSIFKTGTLSLGQFILAAFRLLLGPLLAMLGTFILGVSYVQRLYQIPDFFLAVRYFFAVVFDGTPHSIWVLSGLTLPTLTISGGKPKVEAGEFNLVEKIGGPGWLIIEPGNVVVLERLREPSSVYGAGVFFISRFQKIKQVISLRDQHWVAPPFKATTKDGIEISVHDLQFGYRLCTDDDSLKAIGRTRTNPYPFSTRPARAFTYGRSFYEDGRCMLWGKAIQFRVDGAVTDYINANTLDQITAPPHPGDDPRTIIAEKMTSPQIRKTLRNMLGSELLWVKVGNFELDEKELGEIVKSSRLNAWFSTWDGKARVVRAQGQAAQIAQREGGRAETTANMLRSISQALGETKLEVKDSMNLWKIVLARTAQVIDSMTSVYGKPTQEPTKKAEEKKL